MEGWSEVEVLDEFVVGVGGLVVVVYVDVFSEECDGDFVELC